jgi:hypothetical protein
MLMVLAASLNINWGKAHWKGILQSDARGYYAYLPAIFIYQDLNFGFFEKMEEKYHDPNYYYDYRIWPEGKGSNKYYCGTALAELPFFLTAHLLSRPLGYPADGYSFPYFLFMNLAALFYLLAGLIYLRKILHLLNISERNKSLTLIVAVFGTHLFYYSVIEPGMSHIFSFAFIAMFVFFSMKLFLAPGKRLIILLAALLGILVLIRPVNGLIIFILPFAAGSYSVLRETLLKIFSSYKASLAAGLLLAAAIVSIQLILYKVATGKFFIYSYSEEGFNFSDPHITDILFSYRKGLFLYTPVLLVSMYGLRSLWRHSRFRFYSWLAFFMLITYVFSSWWMWFYGGSFSSRVYVEYIPLFMILLALSLENTGTAKIRRVYIGLLLLLTLFCQVQTYQYRYYQIHWSDTTKELYWKNFLRIDKLISR